MVGTARGLETKLVPEAGFKLELVQVGQLKNVSLATRARTAFDLPRGILRCISLLREFRPHVVIGVGGYASGPAMLAAFLLRIPMMAYEPNAAPGLANRLIGKRVDAAAVNFEQTRRFFRNAEVTGVPVREAFFSLPERVQRWFAASAGLWWKPRRAGAQSGHAARRARAPECTAAADHPASGGREASGSDTGSVCRQRCRSIPLGGSRLPGRHAGAFCGRGPDPLPQRQLRGRAGCGREAVAAGSISLRCRRSSAQKCADLRAGGCCGARAGIRAHR